MRARTCRRAGCSTRLSRANPGPNCWAHTKDLTQLRAGERKPKNVTLPRGVSQTFIDNVEGAYVLTASEQARLKEGEA